MKRRHPRPDTVHLATGDTHQTQDGHTYTVALIPNTPATINHGTPLIEPPAQFRYIAATAKAYYDAHLMVGFDTDEAWELLMHRLEWENNR